MALADLLPLFGAPRPAGARRASLPLRGRRHGVLLVRHRRACSTRRADRRPPSRRDPPHALEGLLAGTIEPDGFNRLILLAGLTASQANILRCYAKYAHQTDFTFSQGYVDSLARLPQLARLIVDLFKGRDSTPKRTTCSAPCWSPPPSRPSAPPWMRCPRSTTTESDAPSWPWSRRQCAQGVPGRPDGGVQVRSEHRARAARSAAGA